MGRRHHRYQRKEIRIVSEEEQWAIIRNNASLNPLDPIEKKTDQCRVEMIDGDVTAIAHA